MSKFFTYLDYFKQITIIVPETYREKDIPGFKVVGKDPKTKKFKLSRKVLLPKPEAETTAE